MLEEYWKLLTVGLLYGVRYSGIVSLAQLAYHDTVYRFEVLSLENLLDGAKADG